MTDPTPRSSSPPPANQTRWAEAVRIARGYLWSDLQDLSAGVVLRIAALRCGDQQPVESIESLTGVPRWVVNRLRRELDRWSPDQDLRSFLAGHRQRGKPRKHDPLAIAALLQHSTTGAVIAKTGVSRSTVKRIRRSTRREFYQTTLSYEKSKTTSGGFA